jgi:hypothetical protein
MEGSTIVSKNDQNVEVDATRFDANLLGLILYQEK